MPEREDKLVQSLPWLMSIALQLQDGRLALFSIRAEGHNGEKWGLSVGSRWN